MQKYIKDFFKSRYLDIDDHVVCEIPGCGVSASDIHHINGSFRGKRTHKEDGSNLIALCRTHHVETHNNNDTKKRQSLLDLVKEILI